MKNNLERVVVLGKARFDVNDTSTKNETTQCVLNSYRIMSCSVTVPKQI